MDTTTNSDDQSNGFLGLIGSLGTAYFNSQQAKASAAAVAAAKTAPVVPPIAAAPVSWIPGVSNQTVVFSSVAIVGLIAALVILRNK